MKKLVLLLSAMLLFAAAEAQQTAQKCKSSCCQQQTACQQGNNGQNCCQQSKTGNIETVAANEFANRIKGRKVVLVDVRTPKEFASGHLKGSMNVEWGNSFKEQFEKAGIKTNRTVALYCRGGRRSMAAANLLAQMGYKVVNLDGGIVAWEKAGLPVVKD